MSNLDTIKEKNKVKRVLKDISFDFTGAHLAYTEASQGGAASGKNEPYLLKATDIDKLTDEQKEILAAIGEEPIALDKDLKSGENTPSSSVEETQGEDENLNKGKEKDMSDNTENLQKEVAALKFDLAVEKAKGQISKFNLPTEIVEGLAKSLASLEDNTSVVKALDHLQASAQEAVEKAATLEKEKEQNTTELQKSLDQEQGNEEHIDNASEPTLVEKAIALKAEQQKKGAK